MLVRNGLCADFYLIPVAAQSVREENAIWASRLSSIGGISTTAIITPTKNRAYCFTVAEIKRVLLAQFSIPIGNRHIASLLIYIKLNSTQLCRVADSAHFASPTFAPEIVSSP